MIFSKKKPIHYYKKKEEDKEGVFLHSAADVEGHLGKDGFVLFYFILFYFICFHF